MPEHLYRTIKVAWRRDASNYPAKRLRDVYAQFGTVEDVVIREEKKKGSALVVFADRAAGAGRLGAGGRPPSPLLAVRAAVPPPGWTTPERGAGGEDRDVGKETAGAATGAPTRLPPGSGIFPGGVSAGGGLFPGGSASASRSAPGGVVAGSGGNVANRDYESVVLDRMRRAQEKARLIAEMEAAEAAEEA